MAGGVIGTMMARTYAAVAWFGAHAIYWLLRARYRGELWRLIPFAAAPVVLALLLVWVF